MRKLMVAFIAFALLAVSACSSSGGTAKFTTHYGQDATVIARHVPGCENASADTDSGIPGLTSEATCTIDGHKVVIYGWSDAKSNTAPMSSINGPLYFRARGEGWTELVTDSVSRDEARSIASRFAKALGGVVEQLS